MTPHNESFEVSIPMAMAGAAAYREWDSDEVECSKVNAVANLVSKVYRAMEAERRFLLQSDQ